MIEAYRVLKPFGWRGHQLERGDVWLVEAGHPRKETLLEQRFATGDAGIPPVDDLLKDKKYQELLRVPRLSRPKKEPEPELVLAEGITRVE